MMARARRPSTGPTPPNVLTVKAIHGIAATQKTKPKSRAEENGVAPASAVDRRHQRDQRDGKQREEETRSGSREPEEGPRDRPKEPGRSS